MITRSRIIWAGTAVIVAIASGIGSLIVVIKPPSLQAGVSCALPNYPDANCTGVPPGTSLTASSGINATTNFQVINGMDVNGLIRVSGYGVTIQNSKMHHVIIEGAAIDTANPPLTIRDSEIDCGGQGLNAIDGSIPPGSGGGDPGSNFDAYRLDISACENGAYPGSRFSIRDSWFHDTVVTGTSHNDGLQSSEGNDATIEHNNINWADTSDLGICNYAGCPFQTNWLIQDNRLFLANGGAYNLYCPLGAGTSNFRIYHNAFVDSSIVGTNTDCDGGEIGSGNFRLPGLQSVALGTSPPGNPLCAAYPSFPDAACTGVPTGTTLTNSGGLTITTPGQVVDGLNITGNVVVNAPNVTIRNTRITSNAFTVIQNNSYGLVVEDSEIINNPGVGNNCHVGIGDANFTIRTTEITGCENAINLDSPGNVNIEDNYFHDLDTVGPSYVFGNDPHTDGIQAGEGAANVIIRHNYIDPVGSTVGVGGTSAIIMYTLLTGTANSNFWVENNYLDGRDASYAMYAPRQTTPMVYIAQNKMYEGNVGYTACVKVGDTVAVFDENRDAGTDALIAADNGVGGGCTN